MQEKEIILRTDTVVRDFPVGDSVVHALQGVSVEVVPGELTILRGRSGSGKTTLLNILGGLDVPTSGSVHFLDQEMSALSESQRDTLRRKNIGFVFQSVALMGHMSAYENVEFGLRIAGYPASERAARARECLQMVGLEKRMHHRPSEMSGGEQQRVAIARAIAHKPKLLLADEPTAEVDSSMALRLMKLFLTLVRDEHIAMLMTTHDPSMMELGHHVYSLEDGLIQSEIHNDINILDEGGK